MLLFLLLRSIKILNTHREKGCVFGTMLTFHRQHRWVAYDGSYYKQTSIDRENNYYILKSL